MAASPEILDEIRLKVNEKPIDLKTAYRKESERYYQGIIPKSILKKK